MATAPAFADTPRTSLVSISTANTNLDGSGTIATVWTAGASGSRIQNVVIKAIGVTTAGVVRLFVHNGSAAFLFHEELVSAITPSATVKAFSASVDFSQPGSELLLQSGYSLRASTHNAEGFTVFAFGADF